MKGQLLPKVSIHDQEQQDFTSEIKIYKQYSYRWIILSSYLIVVFVNGIAYQTFIPNAKQFIDIYEVNDQVITLTGTIYLIMQPIFTFFASSFVVKYGFSWSIILGILLTIIGYSLRLLINHASFFIIIFGQALIGIARPFLLNGQTSLAQNWFYPQHRTAVLTISNVVTTISMVVSLIWPANFIFKNYSYENNNQQEGQQLAYKLQFQQFLFSIILIPIIFCVKNNPPTPPSAFANTDQDVGFYQSIQNLLKNNNFIFIFFTFSFFFGTVKGFGLIVPYLMSPFDFVDTQYSVAGSMLIIGGFLSAGFVSKLVLKYKKYKAIGITLMIITMIITLFTYPLLMTKNQFLLYTQQLLLGFFMIPLVPILIEFGCEIIYPLNGSFSVGVMVSGSTIMALLSSMLLTYTVKGNDSNKGSVLITILILSFIFFIGFILFLFTKEILNRTKEIQSRQSLKKSLYFSENQLKKSVLSPHLLSNELIVGDYPTEHPILDQHNFIENPEVLNPDYIEKMSMDEQQK